MHLQWKDCVPQYLKLPEISNICKLLLAVVFGTFFRKHGFLLLIHISVYFIGFGN